MAEIKQAEPNKSGWITAGVIAAIAAAVGIAVISNPKPKPTPEPVDTVVAPAPPAEVIGVTEFGNLGAYRETEIQAKIANQLGVKLVRDNIIMTNWKGERSVKLEYWRRGGSADYGK